MYSESVCELVDQPSSVCQSGGVGFEDWRRELHSGVRTVLGTEEDVAVGGKRCGRSGGSGEADQYEQPLSEAVSGAAERAVGPLALQLRLRGGGYCKKEGAVRRRSRRSRMVRHLQPQ